MGPPKIDFGLSKGQFRTLRSAEFGLSERSRLEVAPLISCESIREIAKFRPPLLRFRPQFVDSRSSVLRGSALDCPRGPAVHSRSSVLDSSIRDVPPSISVGFLPRFFATLRPRFARFHPRFVGCFVLLSARFRSGRVDSRGSALDSQGCILDSSIRQISSSISTVIESSQGFAFDS